MAMRAKLRELCGTLKISAEFSEDAALLSTVKTPGLVGIQCIVKNDQGAPIGVGHASSVISRINKATDRLFLGLLNGSLTSAISQAGKTLDLVRLNSMDAGRENEKDALYRSASQGYERATDKQKRYLLELASLNLDETERENFAASLDEMTKEEASRAIADFAR